MIDAQREQQLARRLAAGDPDAWRSLYDLYAPAVWRIVARLLGANSADVADVVQETFLAAARSAATYDPSRGSLWLWLCGIARRHVALHFRKLGRQNEILEISQRMQTTQLNGELTARNQHGEPAPEEKLANSELAAMVRATLTDLPNDHGALLAARYLNDDTIEQIADVENCSATAMRSRLARARQAFREKFSRLCSGAEGDLWGTTHET